MGVVWLIGGDDVRLRDRGLCCLLKGSSYLQDEWVLFMICGGDCGEAEYATSGRLGFHVCDRA